MKKILYFIPALAIAALAACGSDSNDDPTPVPGQENGGGENIESDKEYVEQVSREAAAYFKTSDHQEAIDLANDFANLYSELEIPTEWENLGDGYRSAAPAKFFRSIRIGLRSGDMTSLTRSAYYYNFSLSSISGVYEPNRSLGRWVKVGSSNDLVFRFTDSRNAMCVLTAAGSEGEYPVEYYDYYDYYTVNIPRTVTTTLTRSGHTLLKTIVKSVYTPSTQLVLNADMTLCNLQLISATNVSQSRATQTASLMVNGSLFVSSSAEASGSNLLDIDSYDDNAASKLTNGTSEANLLNKLSAKATITRIDKVAEAFDLYYWSGDADRAAAERSLQNAANTINNNLKADLYFGGSKKASYVAKPYFDEWGYGEWSYWDSWVESYIQFNDGTLYGFGAEDFENFLDGPMTVFGELCEAYARAIGL